MMAVFFTRCEERERGRGSRATVGPRVAGPAAAACGSAGTCMRRCRAHLTALCSDAILSATLLRLARGHRHLPLLYVSPPRRVNHFLFWDQKNLRILDTVALTRDCCTRHHPGVRTLFDWKCLIGHVLVYSYSQLGSVNGLVWCLVICLYARLFPRLALCIHIVGLSLCILWYPVCIVNVYTMMGP